MILKKQICYDNIANETRFRGHHFDISTQSWWSKCQTELNEQIFLPNFNSPNQCSRNSANKFHYKHQALKQRRKPWHMIFTLDDIFQKSNFENLHKIRSYPQSCDFELHRRQPVYIFCRRSRDDSLQISVSNVDYKCWTTVVQSQF